MNINLISKGMNLLTKGELDSALETFKLVISNDPSNAMAYAGIATYYELEEDYNNSIIYYINKKYNINKIIEYLKSYKNINYINNLNYSNINKILINIFLININIYFNIYIIKLIYNNIIIILTHNINMSYIKVRLTKGIRKGMPRKPA